MAKKQKEIKKSDKKEATIYGKFFRIVMSVVFALLIMSQISKIFFDVTPPLWKKHKLEKFSNPIYVSHYEFFDMEKQLHSLYEYDQGLTILAFWATWCPYCSVEMPEMADFYASIQDMPVKIIPIIHPGEGSSDAYNFYIERNIDGTLMPPYFPANEAFHRGLKIKGYPSFMIADKYGQVFARFRPDWKDKEGLRSLLEELLVAK
ncbi:TlpA family protein disulfide reductase [Rickettsiales bacterium]|nr:TlpA family protein disulfide reductase [Rickettsiales bacterium]